MTVSISLSRVAECIYALSALSPKSERLFTRDDEPALMRLLDTAVANLTLDWLPVITDIDRHDDIIEITVRTDNPALPAVIEGWLANAAISAARGIQTPTPPCPLTNNIPLITPQY